MWTWIIRAETHNICVHPCATHFFFFVVRLGASRRMHTHRHLEFIHREVSVHTQAKLGAHRIKCHWCMFWHENRSDRSRCRYYYCCCCCCCCCIFRRRRRRRPSVRLTWLSSSSLLSLFLSTPNHTKNVVKVNHWNWRNLRLWVRDLDEKFLNVEFIQMEMPWCTKARCSHIQHTKTHQCELCAVSFLFLFTHKN